MINEFATEISAQNNQADKSLVRENGQSTEAVSPQLQEYLRRVKEQRNTGRRETPFGNVNADPTASALEEFSGRFKSDNVSVSPNPDLSHEPISETNFTKVATEGSYIQTGPLANSAHLDKTFGPSKSVFELEQTKDYNGDKSEAVPATLKENFNTLPEEVLVDRLTVVKGIKEKTAMFIVAQITELRTLGVKFETAADLRANIIGLGMVKANSVAELFGMEQIVAENPADTPAYIEEDERTLEENVNYFSANFNGVNLEKKLSSNVIDEQSTKAEEPLLDPRTLTIDAPYTLKEGAHSNEKRVNRFAGKPKFKDLLTRARRLPEDAKSLFKPAQVETADFKVQVDYERALPQLKAAAQQASKEGNPEKAKEYLSLANAISFQVDMEQNGLEGTAPGFDFRKITATLASLEAANILDQGDKPLNLGEEVPDRFKVATEIEQTNDIRAEDPTRFDLVAGTTSEKSSSIDTSIKTDGDPGRFGLVDEKNQEKSGIFAKVREQVNNSKLSQKQKEMVMDWVDWSVAGAATTAIVTTLVSSGGFDKLSNYISSLPEVFARSADRGSVSSEKLPKINSAAATLDEKVTETPVPVSVPTPSEIKPSVSPLTIDEVLPAPPVPLAESGPAFPQTEPQLAQKQEVQKKQKSWWQFWKSDEAPVVAEADPVTILQASDNYPSLSTDEKRLNDATDPTQFQKMKEATLKYDALENPEEQRFFDSPVAETTSQQPSIEAAERPDTTTQPEQALSNITNLWREIMGELSPEDQNNNTINVIKNFILAMNKAAGRSIDWSTLSADNRFAMASSIDELNSLSPDSTGVAIDDKAIQNLASIFEAPEKPEEVKLILDKLNSGESNLSKDEIKIIFESIK